MDVTFAAFREQFPEEPPTSAFVGVAQGAIEAAIKEALQLHDKRNLATLYLVGHLLALDQEYYDALWRRKDRPDGGSGVVNSEQIGQRRIAYLTMAGESERRAFYVTSPYGRGIFWHLRTGRQAAQISAASGRLTPKPISDSQPDHVGALARHTHRRPYGNPQAA